MKPILVYSACAILGLGLAACNEQGASPAVDKAQDMAAAPVGQTSAATLGSNTVSAYVPNAAMGDMYEIQAADIALERSSNEQVRALATMLKADHTAAATSMKSLVPQAAPEVAIPTELDERRQGLIDNLRSAGAADFDQVFIDQQIAAHNEALTLHRGFADSAEAPALVTHASNVAPKIEAHLRMAEQIKSSL